MRIHEIFQGGRVQDQQRGGLKHRKVDPKTVDVYPIEDTSKCPIRLILKYLSLLPSGNKCEAFYLQLHRKFNAENWCFDNKLLEVIKDMCQKAGLLRSTCATKLYYCNIGKQLTQEIMGHRSLAVRS